MSYGDTINDPGDIKYNTNTAKFLGATGPATVTSNAGPTVTFVSFDSMIDGIRALAKVLLTHLNRAGGSETVSQVATDFLGTSQNNAENPNVASYISAVASGSGLSANTVVNSSNITQLISGILKGEGTSAGVTQADIEQGVSMAGITGDQATVATNASNFGTNMMNGFSLFAQNPLLATTTLASELAPSAVAQSASTITSAAGSTATQAATAATSAATSGISQLIGQFDSESFATRVVLVIVGVLLLAAAVFGLTKTNPVELASRALPLAA